LKRWIWIFRMNCFSQRFAVRVGIGATEANGGLQPRGPSPLTYLPTSVSLVSNSSATQMWRWHLEVTVTTFTNLFIYK
jgi:hypothetical protein